MFMFSHIWLCNPAECSPPGSSVHGISQARILEGVAISFSRGSSWLREWAVISYCRGSSWLRDWRPWNSVVPSLLMCTSPTPLLNPFCPTPLLTPCCFSWYCFLCEETNLFVLEKVPFWNCLIFFLEMPFNFSFYPLSYQKIGLRGLKLYWF